MDMLHKWPRVVRKNKLGFLLVMVAGPKTMTKKNPYRFLKAFVMGHRVKQTWTGM